MPHVIKNSANTSICLILPDLDISAEAKSDPDVESQAKQWSEILRKKYSLTGKDIAKVFNFFEYIKSSFNFRFLLTLNLCANFRSQLKKLNLLILMIFFWLKLN